ncbi:MAG: alpha-1,2-fucosyltransferase [Ruminococcus flavefaciens]|nr:alpha-1,2-fucosyltransferase [Ruminococcus flavefaciens]
MFEYAYLLSLKERGYNVRLSLDLYDITQQHNGWELNNVFDIKETPTRSTVLSRLLTRILVHYRNNPLIESEKKIMQYDCIWENPSKPFLLGVWINSQYFESVRDKILTVYTFKNISKQNLSLSKRMAIENSVSVHIRRGDYLKHPNYLVCDEHYYDEAIKRILNQVESPKFYIFSDDKDWCEKFMQKFDVDFEIIMHNVGADSCQDMFLMSKCKNNIIANSTFSWWGAWLNNDKNKMVIAPRKWFRDKNVSPNLDTWIKI